MAWTPDPAAPLFGLSEASPVNLTILYTPDVAGDAAPDSYSAVWTSTPIPNLVTFSSSAAGLALTGADATGMTPIALDYMKDKVSYRVTQWLALPADAQEIYHYATAASNTVTAQLKVTAYFSGTLTSMDQTFVFTATINYSSGRDRLVYEVNLRR